MNWGRFWFAFLGAGILAMIAAWIYVEIDIHRLDRMCERACPPAKKIYNFGTGAECVQRVGTKLYCRCPVYIETER